MVKVSERQKTKKARKVFGMPGLKKVLSIIFIKLYYVSEWRWCCFMPLLGERNQIAQMGFEKSVQTLCRKADGEMNV